jgi:hypothetical protein
LAAQRADSNRQEAILMDGALFFGYLGEATQRGSNYEFGPRFYLVAVPSEGVLEMPVRRGPSQWLLLAGC